jgi:biopolymer transport protein TolR
MVAAPLMNGGVELDLPNVQGKALPQPDKEPVVVSITKDGRVYLGLEEQAPTNLEELLPRLKAIVANRRGGDEPVMIRGDRVAQYEAVSAVIQKLSEAGFRKLTIVTVSQKAK